ncbi:hypothetical protein ColLi_01443 [Colletotrichum liriopes]|uniref:Uncharacterized protein n=1 Tax=Colletotrichum liriopes TaxID=708192 RepID=A0AA37GCZ8_9PEZI|nr:hypothetical protein ColLi_01443 [Colletotrichum liriopes]
MKLFWYPEKGPDNVNISPVVISNLLLIAVKVHEVLVLASLASVFLSLFRRRLVSEGVRLGFLTSGYRVGDIWYLASGAFWRHGVFGVLSFWELMLASILAWFTLLSLIVGPASGTLLLPSLGWYELEGPFANVDMPMASGAFPDWVWPKSLSEYGWASEDMIVSCNGALGILRDSCPAGGFTVFSNWVDGAHLTNLEEGPTFQDASSNLRRQILITQAVDTNVSDDNPVTLATTTSAFSTISLGLFGRYSKRHDIGTIHKTTRYRLNTTTPMLQPFVQTKCEAYDRDELQNAGGRVRYPTRFLNCYGDIGCLDRRGRDELFPLSYLILSNTSNAVTELRLAIDAPDQDTDGSTLYFIGNLPYTKKEGDFTVQKSWVYACSALARWVPTKLTIDPSVNNTVQSNFSSVTAMREMFKNEDVSVNGSVLSFNSYWMSYVNPALNITRDYYDENGTIVREELPTLALQDITDTLVRMPLTTNGTLIAGDLANSNTKSNAEFLLARLYAAWLADNLARLAAPAKPFLFLERSNTSLEVADLYQIASTEEQTTRYTSKGLDEPYVRDYDADSTKGAADDLNLTMRGLQEEFRAMVPIDFNAERYGYGSGQDSRTQTFAIFTMLAYLGVIGVYALVIALMSLNDCRTGVWGRSRIALFGLRACSDMQDLVVLALRSSAPKEGEQDNDGANVRGETNRVLQEAVRVRSAEGNTVRLVIGDNEGLLRRRG